MTLKRSSRNLVFLFLISLVLISCNRNLSNPSEEKANSTTAQPNATIDPATAATISGVITLQGDAPAPVKIHMDSDPACEMSSKEPNQSQVYVVDHGKLANVYVYIKDGLGNKIYESPKLPAVIDQNGCRYIPHVLAVMVNQPIEIRNSDLALHNVHPSPAVYGNQEWNVSQQPKGASVQKAFSQPEAMMPVHCNQHPWMRMYLNIASNPFFSVSATDGTFHISGVPPGTYTIVAVHEMLGEKTQQITVAPKQNAQLDFKFSVNDK